MSEFSLSRRLAAEALGTAMLVGTVVGSGIMADRLSDDVAVSLKPGRFGHLIDQLAQDGFFLFARRCIRRAYLDVLWVVFQAHPDAFETFRQVVQDRRIPLDVE